MSVVVRAAVVWALAGLVLAAACDDGGARSSAQKDAGHGPKPHGMGGMKSEPQDSGSGTGPIRIADGAILLDAAQFHGGRPQGDASDHDAMPPDSAASPEDEQRLYGEYLVRHVAGCNECHTPRLPSGLFDESKLLSGVEGFADVDPADPTRGLLHSRNLTPDDDTGLGRWSDEQVKRAFQHGMDDEDEVLHWLMPYWIFANMRDEDADAIVAYLRSIPAVQHEVPANQPSTYYAYALPEGAVPESTRAQDDPAYESAQRGRYLAGSVATCMLCHTAPPADERTGPIDVTRMFAGKRKLLAVKMGRGLEDAPLIESFNLTPHANGIGGWTPLDVANVLRAGVAPSGLPTCDPMPSYYGGTFRGMREQDALDLGNYFTSLPPQDTGVIAACCTACHGETSNEDAGL